MSAPPGIDIDAFRIRLNERKTELLSLSVAATDARKPVELDQQSVGRLSRQDALQQQAMANAQEARRGNELQKIDRALARLDEGEFGWCGDCGEAIDVRRLDIDLTATLCAPCAGAFKH
ncbi:MAG: TraR/DksA C4-type zinc finger protein [Pseudomonadota bacterium]